MKLISCYVSSFGKLMDFSFDFSSGLNTIKQDNGWGKSTLATFIKAMFYGINSTKRSVSENERIKYRPWNTTEKFGGYVEFEWGNKTYKLERFFGNKESEDTVRLFDAQTGKEFYNTDNLGNRIFEIDEEGFLSTTYLSQKDFEIKSNSSLTAKFNSVCEIQNTEDFDKALEKLEKKAKLYKYRGDKGLISDTKREILDLEEQIIVSQKSQQTVKLLRSEVDVLQNKLSQLKEQGEALTKAVEKASGDKAIKVKKSHYDELNNEKAQLLTRKKQIDLVFNSINVTQQEIDDHKQINNDLASLNANIQAVQKDLIDLEERKKINSKPEKQNNKMLLVLSALFTVLGVVLLFVQIFAGIGSFVIALLLLVFAFVGHPEKNNQANLLFDDLIKQKKEELDELCDLHRKVNARLDCFIGKFNLPQSEDRNSQLNYISKANFDRQNLVNSLINIEQKIKAYDNDIEKFNSLISDGEDLNLLNQKLALVQEEFSRISNYLASKKVSLSYQENIANGIVELESKKADLTAKLNAYEEEYKLLTTTIKYLTQADENLKVKYREPLQISLNKYLSYIDGKENANIDIDLKLTVEENGVSKDVAYYSKGYQNLYDICKRFALTDVLFTGEKPFIILDDPFYNLDDKKLEKAIDLIKKLSNEYQILYLICHDSRRG